MVASSLIMITAMVIAEAIMYFRVWALGGNTKKLGAILLVQFVGIHVAIYTILGIFLRSVDYQPSPLPTLVACMPKDTNTEKLRNVYAIIVASESMIMLISVAIGFARYRASNNRLLWVFHRDGIFYFVTLAAVTTANIIFDSVAPLEYKFMVAAPQGVLHSILSCRLILHLHEFSEKELALTESEEHRSSIQFASGAVPHTTFGDIIDISAGRRDPLEKEKAKAKEDSEC
ncbi:hypothetical protein DFP72DRAFT_548246 [Ephemerocybe angulata]|uniref:Uncharacterized protein n=1 Tax=Ephemerocybe angulata TaxID=980116 RepID=A0A8H6LZU5_9AGAR|nr:hypothetical protein DFP72DRAFT_548246 [Tulosesus angulatus]